MVFYSDVKLFKIKAGLLAAQSQKVLKKINIFARLVEKCDFELIKIPTNAE